MKLFSIIIPILDPLKSVSILLDQLEHFPEAKERFDVLLINNHDSFKNLDFHTRYQHSFFRFSYHTTGIVSANVARNLGIRFAEGDYLCFLDDDCLILDSSYFQKIEQYFESNPLIKGLGGPYQLSSKANGYDQIYHHLAMRWLESSAHPETGITRNLIGGNCVYKRELFDMGFTFDPAISYGGSELSLNYQLHSHGHELRYYPDLIVQHNPQMSLLSFLSKAYKQGQGSAKQIFKQPALKYHDSSMLMKLYNLFFHLGLISHGRSISLPQKLYQFLEFIQFIKFFNAIKLQFMRVYWMTLPFWGGLKKYTVWIFWGVYPLYEALKNVLIWLRWSIYPAWSWSIGLGSFLLGHLLGAMTRVFYRFIAILGALKKGMIELYWYLEPRVKFPIIKLYFMAVYHWETYVIPLLRKLYIKR